MQRLANGMAIVLEVFERGAHKYRDVLLRAIHGAILNHTQMIPDRMMAVQRGKARLEWVVHTGGTPFAMFYRSADDLRFTIPPAWLSFVRKWNRPARIFVSHDGAAGKEMTDSAPAASAGAQEVAA